MSEFAKACADVAGFPGDVLLRAAQMVEALISSGTLVFATVVVAQGRCRNLPIHLNLKVFAVNKVFHFNFLCL